MLKRINIKSLLQAKDSLNDVAFNEFLQHFGIEIRDAEIEDLRCLSIALTNAECSIGDWVFRFIVTAHSGNVTRDSGDRDRG
jgi:hypothetical protein